MPAGHTKFSASWLSCVDVNNQLVGEWCRKGKDDFHGYCGFCDTDIKCDNSGKAQLLQHAKKESTSNQPNMFTVITKLSFW